MANLLDMDALKAAETALGEYIEHVTADVAKLKDAAQDCKDNMQSDGISSRKAAELEESLQEISKALQQAEELKEKIRQKWNEIWDITHSN